jgi:hypothetical protein
MTRLERQSKSGGARSGRVVRERVERFHRSHLHGRSKTNGMRATGRLAVAVTRRTAAAQVTDSVGTLLPHASATASTIALILPGGKPQGRKPVMRVRTRGLAGETSKRDRPEAGRPGQRAAAGVC